MSYGVHRLIIWILQTNQQIWAFRNENNTHAYTEHIKLKEILGFPELCMSQIYIVIDKMYRMI
jgi:hypothetical protein